MTDNIRVVSPPQMRIKQMAEKACAPLTEDAEKRSTAINFLWGWCNATHEHLVRESIGREPDLRTLLAEIAFWRGMYHLIRRDAKFVIADKIGFVLPTDDEIAGE